ncbi:uncharacterized protein LOC131060344 [Cryptomeria japonica]|uniref:uncharacterized protein LOC131060344 n=1 Tax=Cryptomeria japonica TaxID=3369 RepID=UPI0027D9E9FE|nr:uncharacterized protein LOC131060344 [Cryptomeria japonica]XP_057849504.2 uncharacterized protein LOC131060344 [Cryptomeria japonica]
MSDLNPTEREAMTEKSSVPAEQETSPMPASVDTLSLEHAQSEGVGANESTVVQPLSHNLFWVMCILSDKQDYSFVEKIQLRQDEVLRLCNKLVPSAASASSDDSPRVRINFNSLNQLCLSAVGYYGDKDIIIRTFRKESLVDDSVLARMEGGLLEPGFYVSLPDKGNRAVVFYWHEGEELKKASGKDFSCNFIRYLVELCDTVHVCVKESYRFEALAASATSTSAKAKRTKRIEVSSVKNSENDVELMPGYNVRIDGGAYSENDVELLPGNNVQIANNCNGTAIICEGYHHCCFLTTEKSVPRKSTKTEEETVKASEFCNRLKSWLSGFNVVYSRLSNEQFVELLKNCQPQDFQIYTKFKESIDTRESAINTTQFEKFERCFLKVISEFCPHVHLFVGGESSETNLESNSRSDAGRLEQLYRELSAILTGEDGTLLPLGSDIEFISSNGAGEHVVTVEGLGQGKETTPFISYGQEVHARCSSKCGCSSKIDAKVTIQQLENGTKDFPLSGDKIVFTPVTAKSGSKNEIKGQVNLASGFFSTIRSWVASMVPTELRTLEINIIFAAFLLASDDPLAQSFMQNHLRNQNIQILLPNFQVAFEKFLSVHCARSTYPEALLSSETVKAVCGQVYKENIKELWTRLFRKGGSFVNSRLREVEEEFVQQLKEKMSVLKKDYLVTRFIEEVTVENQKRSSWFPWSSQAELKVKVTVEENLFNIAYKVCELTPMEKDISEVNSNSGNPIVLTYGEPLELTTINPQNEKLYKVVVLKSRELIVFVHSLRDSSLYLYHCPKIGVSINKIHAFKRGFELVAVDEATRSIALYEKEKSKILIYKFDECFSKVYWSGIELNLETFCGSKIIVWMHLIPGKMELLLVDDTNQARVAEIHEKPMMKAKHVSLSLQKHFFRACVSDDGRFFIVFRQLQRQSEDIDVAGARQVNTENILEVDIYVLGDTMTYLKTIPLNARGCRISDFQQFGVKFMCFGLQTLVLLYSPVDSPGIIFSHVLKCSLGQIKGSEDETEIDVSCPYLGYIFHIFDKFATAPKLFPDAMKRITFKVVLGSSSSDRYNSEACLKYSKALIKELQVSKEKDFSSTEIQFEVNNVENCRIQAAAVEQTKVKMGTWIRKLVCLVPIQVARVENNAMLVLKDGLQLPDVSYVESVSLSNSICFGFYDTVLSSWKDKVKVISSIGKQSSGKSYLLNHLSGSLLDVGGGRCTDGVWMTIVTGEYGDRSCLYVLLDFEGLGSFERSEQEDMLLAVLNAAVTNITIFNKKGFRLDKDTESAFSQFQSGFNLLKQDKKSFKGLFYIAIKDVDKSDVEDHIQEFCEKISQICIKSTEKFSSKMYDVKVEIAAMAPYNRSEYYRESLSELAETVAERVDFCYDSGFTFLRDLKLIIAQIASKDRISIHSKRASEKVDILRRNLLSAVQLGSLPGTNVNEEIRVLHNFDTKKEIPDFPVVVGDISWSIKDSGLCLSKGLESASHVTVRDVLSQIRSRLEIVLPRNGRSGNEWFSLFQKFLVILADRRRYRVQEWISSNTTDICDTDEVKSLKLEANVALDKVKKGLSVCGCKCSDCFWRCVMDKGHGDQHSCMGSHSCTENCSYCSREGNVLRSCRGLAGHEGAHDCKEKNHTCSEMDSGDHGQLKGKNKNALDIESTYKKHQCQRSSFEYEAGSEQCFDSTCQSSDYFLRRHIDQSGLHDTVHSNVRNAGFIPAGKDINIQDSKHKWGEIVVPNMYCKKQGGGYNHLVPCPGFSKFTGKLYDGSRHKTVPQEVMTHESFWQYVSSEEFDYCKSEELDTKSGLPAITYCTETGQNLNSAGYITDDSHHFGCDQSKNVPHHVIFVIDKSGSMGFSDSTPSMIKFDTHKCRLGCVYEDILWFIRLRLKTVSDDSVSVVLFDESATVAIEMEDMKESIVDHLLQRKPGGGAIYSSGLDAVEKILIKGSQQPSVNVKMPVVIFLSDGANNGGENPLYCVDKMKRAEPRLMLHTIKFGMDPTTDTLIEMAKKGGGTFGKKLNENLLARGS